MACAGVTERRELTLRPVGRQRGDVSSPQPQHSQPQSSRPLALLVYSAPEENASPSTPTLPTIPFPFSSAMATNTLDCSKSSNLSAPSAPNPTDLAGNSATTRSKASSRQAKPAPVSTAPTTTFPRTFCWRMAAARFPCLAWGILMPSRIPRRPRSPSTRMRGVCSSAMLRFISPPR